MKAHDEKAGGQMAVTDNEKLERDKGGGRERERGRERGCWSCTETERSGESVPSAGES